METVIFTCRKVIITVLLFIVILGLGYMLMEGAYTDAFILHEKSKYDSQFPLSDAGDDSSFLHGQDIADPRKAMQDTWFKQLKFQPLWKIRNYFGEKIALYFGWLGENTFALLLSGG